MSGRVYMLIAASAQLCASTVQADFDPDWRPVAETMCTTRSFHTATLIENGDFAGSVLIAGGVDAQGQPMSSVELFDPKTQRLQPCAAMATPRAYHTATWVAVDQGQSTVLFVGGYGPCSEECNSEPGLQALDNYELYDLRSRCNAPDCVSSCDCAADDAAVQSLPDHAPRAEHTATRLGGPSDPTGTRAILVAGGVAAAQSEVLLFYPGEKAFDRSEAWTIGPRFGHTATFIPRTEGDWTSGIVFLAGGSTRPLANDSATTEDIILTPLGGGTRSVRQTNADNPQRRSAHTHSASLLDGSQILLWGGDELTQPAKVLFKPYFESGGTVLPNWTAVAPWRGGQTTRYATSIDTFMNPLLHGTLIVGGVMAGSCNASTATPFYGGSSWSPRSSDLRMPRVNHTVTPVLRGRSLVAVGGAMVSGACVYRALNTLEMLSFRVLGDACQDDAECITGHCVDGVCCESACPHERGSATACQTCKEPNALGRCVLQRKGEVCGQTEDGCVARCDGARLGCPTPESMPCELPRPDAGLSPMEINYRTQPRRTLVSCSVRDVRSESGAGAALSLMLGFTAVRRLRKRLCTCARRTGSQE